MKSEKININVGGDALSELKDRLAADDKQTIEIGGEKIKKDVVREAIGLIEKADGNQHQGAPIGFLLALDFTLHKSLDVRNERFDKDVLSIKDIVDIKPYANTARELYKVLNSYGDTANKLRGIVSVMMNRKGVGLDLRWGNRSLLCHAATLLARYEVVKVGDRVNTDYRYNPDGGKTYNKCYYRLGYWDKKKKEVKQDPPKDTGGVAWDKSIWN